jgi:hypothetical protein
VTDPPHPLPDHQAIELPAALRGAAAALIVAVPAGFAQRAVNSGTSPWGLLFLIILVGFAWGGAVAAKADTSNRALLHGLVAGLLATAGYLIIGIVARAASGSEIKPISLAFTALLGVSCALVGAELGDRRRRQRAASDDESPETPDAPRGDRS